MTMLRYASAVFLLCTFRSTAGGQTPHAPTTRIQYGAASTSFGELLVPSGGGRFPVAVLIHGGCWLSTRSSVADMRALASMLAEHGVASWNIEYRRVGHEGGGWPGTFRDLSDATDYVREPANSHPLDPQRVVVVGHLSGGYSGAWLAGRRHLPSASPLVGPSPVKVSGVVVLDAFLDPRVIDSRGVDGRLFCDEAVLPRLVGGNPDSVPNQLRQASPLSLLPFGVPQEYVVSSLRYPVTPQRPLAAGRTTLAVLDYPRLAREAGDSVIVQIVPDAGHFDFVTPSTKAWAAVASALVRIFRLR